MSDTVKTYRIKAVPGEDSNLNVSLDQDYDILEILSLKLEQKNDFKLHSSNYGIIVGRVIANGGFGVPNAKVSVFIEADEETLSDPVMEELYPFTSTFTRNSNKSRYNLLPDYEVNATHQAIGNIPKKEYILDNDIVMEVFDKYYKFTTRTNGSGDYFLSGIPVGQHNLHMDVDLSDCGVLSQRPRDFVFKGYNIEQFENPNQFKKSKEIDKLSQVFTQNQIVNVVPFWGNEDASGEIGITRADIDIAFKFEPTCVFMGCIVGDNKSNGISEKCIPTENMGSMDELISGEGTIEMIRKTPEGKVEEFQIKGTELINSNGVWCYQIPMNLDYVVTDEYGNIVPSDSAEKGIPTRTRVRFRMSMQDFGGNSDFYQRCKVLVPHNPDVRSRSYSKDDGKDILDYNFGTNTDERSFRDLFWDNVYTVKSYFPRFQKHKNVKNERFTGIKHCNIYGQNNPMPYNNIRIRLPFMFTIVCALIKTFIRLTWLINKVTYVLSKLFGSSFIMSDVFKKPSVNILSKMRYKTIGDGMCPDLDNWYFAPGGKSTNYTIKHVSGKNNDLYNFDLLEETFKDLKNENSYSGDSSDNIDKRSIDEMNKEGDTSICLTTNIDYFVSCIEMNLAQEYKVINFDFYNDWINGVIYFPRWAKKIRKKRTFFFGLIKSKEKTRGCLNDTSVFSRTRYYTQQCSLLYGLDRGAYSRVVSKTGCGSDKKQKCHSASGMRQYKIFNGDGGIVKESETSLGQYVHYMKPCEFSGNRKVNLFATDVVLLGSLKEDNEMGIPQSFKELSSSSYKMPTNLALTNMEDSGYLYTTEDGTICGSKTSSSYGNNPVSALGDGNGKQGFAETEKAKSTTNDQVYFTGEDDAIPITESSGIAWNYNGPGQRENNFRDLYFPGGLFLGMSCTNSQTNIKSCVNLQRVCEQGAEISHRQEKIGSFKDQGGEKVPEYYYVVPNGLIGNSDITGTSFRSMFATLNSRKLFADKINKETGYPMYGFEYSRPSGFGGDLSYSVTPYNKSYNYHLSPEEVNDASEKLNLSRQSGYDPEEKNRTFSMSNDEQNLDYYRFRMGIPYNSELETIDSGESKFLIRDGSYRALPQYCNSFYFYFGLKEGGTAIDELKKQFFSNCQHPVYSEEPMEVFLEKGESHICDFTSSIMVEVKNGQGPYTITLENMATGKKEDVRQDSSDKIFSGLKDGSYKVSVKDATDNQAVNEISIAFESIIYDLTPTDFKVDIPDGESAVDTINRGANGTQNGREKVGGYINAENEITIDVGNDEETFDIFAEAEDDLYPNSEDGFKAGEFSLVISDGERYCMKGSVTNRNISLPDDVSGQIEVPFVTSGSMYGDRYRNIHLWNPYGHYFVYLGFSCYEVNGELKKFNYRILSDFNFSGVRGLDIHHGCELLSYKVCLKDLKDFWWENDYNDPFRTRHNPDEIWALQHFTTKQTIGEYDKFNVNVKNFNVKGGYGTSVISGVPEKVEDGNVKNHDDVCINSETYNYNGYSLELYGVHSPTWSGDKKIKEHYGYFFMDDNYVSATKVLDTYIVNVIESGNKVYYSNEPINLDERYVGHYLLSYVDGIGITPMKILKITPEEIETGCLPEEMEKKKYYWDYSTTFMPYSLPIIWRPFYVTGTLIQNNYIGLSFKQEENFASNLEYWIGVASARIVSRSQLDMQVNNGILYQGSNKYQEYTINGRNIILRDPEEKDGFMTRGYDICYDETPEEGFSISISEEAPADYESSKKLNSYEKIDLRKITYSGGNGFYDDIVVYKNSKPDVIGESGENTRYFLFRKDDIRYPFPYRYSWVCYQRNSREGIDFKRVEVLDESMDEVIAPVYFNGGLYIFGFKRETIVETPQEGTEQTASAEKYKYSIYSAMIANRYEPIISETKSWNAVIDEFFRKNLKIYKKATSAVSVDTEKIGKVMANASKKEFIGDLIASGGAIDLNSVQAGQIEGKYIMGVEFSETESYDNRDISIYGIRAIKFYSNE